MDADVKTESSDKRLSNLVAVTVVILSVFMAVTKIKYDNINQAMQKPSRNRWTPGRNTNPRASSCTSTRTGWRNCGCWRLPAILTAP